MQPLGKGSKIDLSRVQQTRKHHSRKWMRVASVLPPGAHNPFTHYGCTHNEIVGLRNRVLGAVPQPTRQGLTNLWDTTRLICSNLPKVTSWPIDRMPYMYSGRKRERYLRAVQQVRRGRYKPKDASVQCFVKFEKLFFKDEKPNPDPRIIQYRSARYCVKLAQHLKPCEEYLYELHGDGTVLPETRIIGKGLSQGQRATLLKNKWRKFVRPVAISLDCTRFDKHLNKPLMRIEHHVYQHMNADPEFKQLLSRQLVNRGYTRSGIRYSVVGRRMSGDMNTALGNCVVMVIMVATVMRLAGLRYEMIDDGDDCLVIVEQSDQALAERALLKHFSTFGMVLKLENISTVFEQVEWCQCRPVFVNYDTVRFVRNPVKVFTHAISGSKYFGGLASRKKMVNTIGLCELALNQGVPVMQEFALALIRNADTDRTHTLVEGDDIYYRVHRELKARKWRNLSKATPLPVTSRARTSFALAWGISPHKQRRIEAFFKEWTFNLEGEVYVPDLINVEAWSENRRCTCEVTSLREWLPE